MVPFEFRPSIVGCPEGYIRMRVAIMARINVRLAQITKEFSGILVIGSGLSLTNTLLLRVFVDG